MYFLVEKITMDNRWFMFFAGTVFIAFSIFLFGKLYADGIESQYRLYGWVMAFGFNLFGIISYFFGIVEYIETRYGISVSKIKDELRREYLQIRGHYWLNWLIVGCSSIVIIFISTAIVLLIIDKNYGSLLPYSIVDYIIYLIFFMSFFVFHDSLKKKKTLERRLAKLIIWIGGKASNSSVWREAVKSRDNYKCIFCGATDDLQSHHLAPQLKYRSLKYILLNGVTLCKRCHGIAEMAFRRLQKVCDVRAKI